MRAVPGVDAGNGGGRGIRTPESLSTLTVFKTGAFNRSAIPPFTILPDSIILRGVSLCRFWLFGLSRHLCHYFVTKSATSPPRAPSYRDSSARTHQTCGLRYCRFVVHINILIDLDIGSKRKRNLAPRSARCQPQMDFLPLRLRPASGQALHPLLQVLGAISH